MPRARAVRCEPCDCLDCRQRHLLPGYAPATKASSVARLEPPPRSLVIAIDGALSCDQAGVASIDLADCRHLDGMAREGCAGRLVLRQGGASLAQQILGLAAAAPLEPNSNSKKQQGLQERFPGLQAVLWTDSPAVAAAGASVGCQPAVVLPSWPAPKAAALQIRSLLDIAPPEQQQQQDVAPGMAAVLAQVTDAAAQDDSPDMLLLLLGAASAPTTSTSGTEDAAACNLPPGALAWLDSLVRELNQVPGARETVMVTVVLGCSVMPPCALQQMEDQPLLTHAGGAAADFAAVGRPQQSFQFAGLEVVEVAAEHPAVVVHHLPGVIRVDRVAELDLPDLARHGGGGCILAEHLLPEVCFKLGRALKYGA